MKFNKLYRMLVESPRYVQNYRAQVESLKDYEGQTLLTYLKDWHFELLKHVDNPFGKSITVYRLESYTDLIIILVNDKLQYVGSFEVRNKDDFWELCNIFNDSRYPRLTLHFINEFVLSNDMYEPLILDEQISTEGKNLLKRIYDNKLCKLSIVILNEKQDFIVDEIEVHSWDDIEKYIGTDKKFEQYRVKLEKISK